MSTAEAGRPAPGEIVLHQGLALIETDDPLLLLELEADPRLRSGLVGRLSPCVAVVRPGADSALIQELLKAGHTPKVSDP